MHQKQPPANVAVSILSLIIITPFSNDSIKRLFTSGVKGYLLFYSIDLGFALPGGGNSLERWGGRPEPQNGL